MEADLCYMMTVVPMTGNDKDQLHLPGALQDKHLHSYSIYVKWLPARYGMEAGLCYCFMGTAGHMNESSTVQVQPDRAPECRRDSCDRTRRPTKPQGLEVILWPEETSN